MRTKESHSTRYFILGVAGMYQRWADTRSSELKYLTEPKPFVGYVENVEWGYSIGTDLKSAHRFKQPSKSPLDPKLFGPWWYVVTEQHWIEVVETVDVTRAVLT